MQYESVILELMTRIKNLESELATAKTAISDLERIVYAEDNTTPATSESNSRSTAYTKTNDHMLNVCYTYGKRAYLSTNANIGELADRVASETGMNRNSAFMYIYAVKSMMEGVVFKRGINKKALRQYLNAIHQEFGKEGLTKAVTATKAHAAYLQENGIPYESTRQIAEEFERLL